MWLLVLLHHEFATLLALDVLHLTLTVLSIQSFRAIVFCYLLANAKQASSWF